MHTRRTAPASQQAAPLAALPAELQHCILAALIDTYSEPSANGREYELYPYKTTLAWVLSLGRVCKGWQAQLCSSAVLCRRIRLERLLKVVMAHDYVHHIQSATSKATRARKHLPASIQLPYQPGTAPLRLTVIKQLSARERRGLPATALILAVDGSCVMERRLLQPLLADVAVLDARHNAAFVLKVCVSSLLQRPRGHTDGRRRGQQELQQQGPQQEGLEAQEQQGRQQQQQQQEDMTAGSTTATSAASTNHMHSATPTQHGATSAQLVTRITSAYTAMPDRVHQAVAMAVSEAGMGVYFIPTVAGFRRQVPLSATAAQQ